VSEKYFCAVVKKGKVNKMKRYLYVALFFVLLIQCSRTVELQMVDGRYPIQNKYLQLDIDRDGRGIVSQLFDAKTTRCLAEKSLFAFTSDGKEIPFAVQEILVDNSDTFAGKAKRYIIHATDRQAMGASVIVHLFAPEKYQNVLLSTVQITNGGDRAFALDTLIVHRYLLQSEDADTKEGQAPFWAFCGGNYEERFDWIEPMIDGFYRENPMHPTGGNPYTGVWNPKYGIGIMSLELRQEPRMAEVGHLDVLEADPAQQAEVVQLHQIS
jgi:hypothetical protein